MLKWYRQIYNNILTKKYFLIKISKITNLAWRPFILLRLGNRKQACIALGFCVYLH